MSLTHTANAAGRRRSALAPAAAGDGSEQCLWWRLLFAALLPGRRGFLPLPALLGLARGRPRDRKSTRLHSSHLVISYAAFCLAQNKTAASRPLPRLYTT